MRRPIKAAPATSSRLKKRRHILRSVMYVLFLVAGVSALSWVARAQVFQINEIKVEGAHDLDALALTSDVQAELAGAYLGLVPKTNRFVYPKARILHKLETNYPRLASSTAHARLSGTLEVGVAEEPLLYARCIDSCVYINSAGRALGALSGPREGIVILIGTTTPVHLLDIANKLGGMGVNIREIRESGPDFVLVTSEGWELRIASDTPEVVGKRVQAAFAADVLGDAHARANLEYLDVRFGNKLFYKFK